MEVTIIEKAKKEQRGIRFHYPQCPSCGNKEYKILVVCHECSFLVCDSCKGGHK